MSGRSVEADSLRHQSYDLIIPDITPADAGNWRVASRGIYYVRRGTTGTPDLVRFDLATGISRQVATLKEVPFQAALAVDADGDRFLCTQIERDEGDVMLIEPSP